MSTKERLDIDQAIKELEQDILNPPKIFGFPFSNNTDRLKEIIVDLTRFKLSRTYKKTPKEIIDAFDFRSFSALSYKNYDKLSRFEGEQISTYEPRDGSFIYQLGIIERDYSVLDFKKCEAVQYLELANPLKVSFAIEDIEFKLAIRDNPIDGYFKPIDSSSINIDTDLFVVNESKVLEIDNADDEDLFIGTIDEVREFIITSFRFTNVYEDILNNIDDITRFSIKEVSYEYNKTFNIYKYTDLEFVEDFGYY
ncbi:MAG: hypothetical protein ACRC6T_08120 [Sarcina sp.]